MKIEQLLDEAVRPNVLYHAVDAERAIKFLQANTLEARTFQRIWPDGKRRHSSNIRYGTPEHKEYEDSWQMKGISTTRDVNYAKQWKKSDGIVFAFSKDKLAQRYKIVPYNWMSTKKYTGSDVDIDRMFRHKIEREEFVVTSISKKTFNDLEVEWEEQMDAYEEGEIDEHPGDKIEFQFKQNSKPITNLDTYLEGFYLSQKTRSLSEEEMEWLMNHPLFLGRY